MKHIDTIEKYKGNTYCIIFSDETREYINSDIVCEYHLAGNMDIPENAWEQVVHSNRLRTAKERALYLLDYKDYSYTELFKKLEQNYPEDVCFEVMSRLIEIGVINDRRYSANFARYLVETKKYGYYRCVQEMRLKGLDRDFIEEALAPYKETTIERLCELIESKYARKISDRKSLDKVKNALVRAGYSYSDIKDAFEEFDFELED